ncbi:MAG: PAS domain S-box protein [Candidatus Abyssobacteria bacterium SURF_5]|uniref:histidine kinase n=1 Tax=Abyssobacteria bacterium (strain SURF_5) TaxID=2093360 RepID=A0A3A4P6Q9_ABYX5|nr:MAG: PAS domain S-box protein [Candidatus Abyssubacteria bacterium SURF_5]
MLRRKAGASSWTGWVVQMKKDDRSDSSYQAIFNAANDAIFVHDIDTGEILDANEKACEMFGYAKDEIRRLTVEDLGSGEKPYTLEEARCLIQRAARGQPQVFEWRSKDRSGRLFWVEVSLKHAMIEGKQRMLALVRKIDGRKKVEEAVRRRIEFTRLITSISMRFINMPVDEIDGTAVDALRQIGEFASVDRSYIFQFYNDGGKMENTHEWCAEGIEPQAQRLKGLPVEDFSWFFSQIKDGRVFTAQVRELPPEAAIERAEWELEEIQSLACVPLLLRGVLIGFIGFDSVRQEKTWDEDDIALLKIVGEIFANALDRKRIEQALRESETRYRFLCERLQMAVEQKVAELRQAQSLAAIGQMVSVVAHEVRNPLQSIRTGMDVLHLEMAEDERKEVLADMDQGVDLLSSIITELLEYARPMELRRSSRPVGALVEEALGALSRKLQKIDVVLELDDQGREISVDGIKVTAALTNLISNSIDAMPDGGSLCIRSRFGRENGRDVVRFSIIDTGCGIAEDNLPKVQEAFFTTKIRGTGLGLPICKKIIEAHEGSMLIRSKVNEGTAVEIVLPV